MIKRKIAAVVVAASSIMGVAAVSTVTASPAGAYCTGWACDNMDKPVLVRYGSRGCTLNWDATIVRCYGSGISPFVMTAPYGKHFYIDSTGVWLV